MCISSLLQVSVTELMANMPLPNIARKLLPKEKEQDSTTTNPTTKPTTKPATTGEHKEYGEAFTTVCTQCKKVLVPELLNIRRSQGISIRLSNEDDAWISVDDLSNPQPSSSLSHGLCHSCFENMNADLSLSPLSLRPSSSSRRAVLCKSLSSPHLTRALPPPPSAPKVLVVDDNRLQRQIHKRMVEQEGFECDVAQSGEEAIEKIKENGNYCLVLMDLVMAPLDGWTTSRRIRRFSAPPPPSSFSLSSSLSHSSPRIVAITGLQVDEKLNRECLDAGMDDVVQKPVSPASLSKVLSKHAHSTKEK